jgi:hypothetical protein
VRGNRANPAQRELAGVAWGHHVAGNQHSTASSRNEIIEHEIGHGLAWIKPSAAISRNQIDEQEEAEAIETFCSHGRNTD